MELLLALEQQADGLQQSLVAITNLGRLEEYAFGSAQALTLDLSDRATEAIGEMKAFGLLKQLIETLLQVATRDNLPVAVEIADLAGKMASAAVLANIATPFVSKPLAAFPTEPRIHHTVFVDEAGTASWSEVVQPVLLLCGVLVDDDRIAEFDRAAADLLSSADVAPTTEIHAQPMLANDGALAHLDAAARFTFLKQFAQLGVRHCLGIHHLGMLKPLVKDPFRRQIARLGFDPYTSLIVYFNVTLRAACAGRIGFEQYRYLFDRTDKYGRDIKQIVAALKSETNGGLRAYGITGEPTPIDSSIHRFVQFADVAAYFLTRYRQLEVKMFNPRESLLKHSAEIQQVHELLRPRLLNFVKQDLWRLVDWQLLQEWRHPRPRKGRR